MDWITDRLPPEGEDDILVMVEWIENGVSLYMAQIRDGMLFHSQGGFPLRNKHIVGIAWCRIDPPTEFGRPWEGE